MECKAWSPFLQKATVGSQPDYFHFLVIVDDCSIILIISSQVRLGLPNRFFAWRFRIKMFQCVLFYCLIEMRFSSYSLLFSRPSNMKWKSQFSNVFLALSIRLLTCNKKLCQWFRWQQRFSVTIKSLLMLWNFIDQGNLYVPKAKKCGWRLCHVCFNSLDIA